MDESFGDEFDEDLDEPEEKEPTFYEKDCILFLIDARPRMMQPAANSTAEPPLVQALGAVATSMRGRVIAGDNDLVGVLLFGTKHAMAPEGIIPAKNTFVLLPLEVPSASSIEKLQTLHASRDFSEFGHMDEQEPFDITATFWQASDLYKQSRTNKATRARIFILTNGDCPCPTPEAIQRAELRAKDFGEAGVIVEPFLFPPPPPAPPLDLSEGSFWLRIISAARKALPEAVVEDAAGAVDEAEAGGALSVPGALAPASWVCEDACQLEARLVRAQHRRKPYATLEFRLGPAGAPSLCVKMVTVIAPFSRPAASKLDAKTNEPLVSEKASVSMVDGAVLTQDDMYKTFDFGGKMLYFNPSDVSTSTVASDLLGKDEPPLLLLGFRPLDALKPYLNMRNSTFLEPSDRASGSVAQMQALVEAMVTKERFALARYRKVGAPSLVALLPQQREEDALSGLPRLPCGLHMIYLPFSDALRFPELPPPIPPSALTDEQLHAAERLVQTLSLPAGGAHVVAALPNPASEAHFQAIESAAFTHAAVSALHPVTDTTLPDAAWLGDPGRAEAVSSFLDAFGVTGEPAAGGPADRPAKRLKVAVPQTQDEWMQAHREERLADLTAAVLKDKCREAGLPVSGKKDELVARVAVYLRDKALEELNA